MTALVRPARAIAWELRTAWATGRRVAITLDRCDLKRVEGWVDHIAATDATVTVAGWHIPVERVLAVHRPSRLGDSTVCEGERWARAAKKLDRPGQEALHV